MKEESLVIANQHVAVNAYLSLVHTARHTMEVSLVSSMRTIKVIQITLIVLVNRTKLATGVKS